MTRQRLPLLLCLLPILAASMSHVAGAFGAYERADSWPYWGWLAAVGIDAAIALLVWRLIDGEHRGGDRWALAGVLLASAVSAQTNLAHALTVAVERGIGGRVLAAWASSTWWAVLGVLAVSITLPVLVGVLAAVAHGDAKTEPAKERKPRTKKTDAPAMPDPLPELGAWTTYGPHVAQPVVEPRKRKPAAEPQPAPSTADAARAIAAAEPGIARVEIARRLQVHPSQVSRALNGATTTAGRNGQSASAGEVVG